MFGEGRGDGPRRSHARLEMEDVGEADDGGERESREVCLVGVIEASGAARRAVFEMNGVGRWVGGFSFAGEGKVLSSEVCWGNGAWNVACLSDDVCCWGRWLCTSPSGWTFRSSPGRLCLGK